MNLDQPARPQHVVLIVAAIVLLIGGGLFWISASTPGTPRVVAVSIGGIFIAVSAIAATLAGRSLDRALRRDARTAALARGAFALTPSSADALVRLNARIASHFGLAPRVDRPPMPTTFGRLCEATVDLAIAARLRPAQLNAARTALAAALGLSPATLAWSSDPARLLTAGRGRFARWGRLRAAAPSLPPATVNAWVEHVAIGLVLAALIATCAVVAEHFNDGERPAHPALLEAVKPFVQEALKWLIVAVGGVLLIPVFYVGRRFATRLPREIDTLGALATCFANAPSDRAWTHVLVTEHLRDLVAAELGIERANLRSNSVIDATLSELRFRR